MALQHLRSSTANKRPLPGSMSDGQLAINTNTGSPGLFFKDSAGALIKVGPVHVGTTAPNTSPAAGGETGNTVGEQWLDTSGSTYVFKVWDGSAWRSETGEFVNASGDTMTGALGIIAGTAGAPGLYISGDTNTGFYSPGADQLALSTGGTGRLSIDANGNINADSGTFYVDATNNRVGIGTTSPTHFLTITTTLATQRILSIGGPGEAYSTGASAATSFSPAGTQLNIDTNSSITDNAALINFSAKTGTGNNTGVYLGAVAGTASNGPAHIVFGRRTATSTWAESARIDSSGRLGVGTTSPTSNLSFGATDAIISNDTVDGSDTKSISLAAGGTQGTGRGGFVKLYGNENAGGPGIAGTVDIASGSADGSEVMLHGRSSTSSLRFLINAAERARIDSSGRLLVGTATARANFYNAAVSSNLLVENTGPFTNTAAFIRNQSDSGGSEIVLGKSKTNSVGGNGLVANADTLGAVSFQGADGTEFVEGAFIRAQVDGSPGANDMPGRLVFATTSDGASTPTERMRITNDGVFGYNQPAPVAVDTTATLTVADLKTGIITSTTAAAVTMTLPTGTLTEGGFAANSLYNNFTFEWSVINTGATNAVTVAAGTAHTLVGSGTVAAGVSGRFASRRTASNTFVTYRLS